MSETDNLTGDQLAESINIDLEDVVDTQALIPAKTYFCRVKSAEMKKKDVEGAYPYIDCRLNPNVDEFGKKVLFLVLSFHPDALFNIKEFLTKAGYQGNLKRLNGKDILEYVRTIKSVGVTVTVGKDQNGEPRNEVKRPYHAGI